MTRTREPTTSARTRRAQVVPVARRAGSNGARHSPDAPANPRRSIRRTRARSSTRRFESTHHLEGFELRSVASAAIRYYTCAFAVLTLGVVLAWVGASVFGVVGRVEEFMRSIGFRDFRFAGFQVILGGILLCVAAVAFLTVMTVLAAAFYNLLGRRDHGVGIRITPIRPPIVVGPPPRHGSGNGNGSGNGSGNGNGNGDSRRAHRSRTG